jgi:DNA-binding CsgD family transcriptional regulator
MTTIRPDITDIHVAIAGNEKHTAKFRLPPAAPGIGRVATALLPDSTMLTTGVGPALPGLNPGLALALSPTPALRTWARAAADALGVIGLPAAVLSRSHRLAAANALMERLIPQLVQDRPTRFGLVNRRADAMVGQALLQVQAGGAAPMIPLAATAHLAPSIVHVFPAQDVVQDTVQDAVQSVADAEVASCVVVITTVSRARIAAAEVLRGLFDLTPAEARVARGIAAGKTVRDLAAEAGLAPGTVRQQLKSVFSKMGVSRQADLVALLAGCGLSFPGDGPAG